MRAWHALSRTVFHIDLPDDDGASRTFSVDVPFFNLEGRVSLYLDGRREAWAEAPAVFPVPGGVIEVKTRSEEHTSELQSRPHLVCRLLLEKKKRLSRMQRTSL